MEKSIKIIFKTLLMMLTLVIFSKPLGLLFDPLFINSSNWIGSSSEWVSVNGFFISCSLFLPMFFSFLKSNFKYIFVVIFVLLELFLYNGNNLLIGIIVMMTLLGLLIGTLLSKYIKPINSTQPVDKKLGGKSKKMI